MRRSGFGFGIVLTLSILAVIMCFEYADSIRGYNATGGEVFMIALPLMLVHSKITKMAGKIERLKQQKKRMNEKMFSL